MKKFQERPGEGKWLVHFELHAVNLYSFAGLQGAKHRLDDPVQLPRLRKSNYQYTPHATCPPMNTQLNCLVKSAGIIGQFGWLFAIFSASAASLEVRINGIAAPGTVHAALHAGADADWQGQPLALARSDDGPLLFEDLPPGRYALQLFQDINGNGQLDLSKRGIPREPVGLSGNPPLRQGRPALAECLFEVHPGSNRIDIRLVKPPRHAARAANR